MHDGVRFDFFKNLISEAIIAEIAHFERNGTARGFVPEADTPVQWRNCQKRLNALFQFPLTLSKIVNDSHVVTFRGQVHRRRPTEIAVAAKNQNSHLFLAERKWEGIYGAKGKPFSKSTQA